jgi:hypothetical protein
MTALVGNNEMARLLGMSTPAFAKGGRQGRFTPSKRDKNGKLIEKELVRKQGAELGAIMMGIIDSWASRLAPEFASMKNADEHDFHLKLSHETNLLKQEIIKKCEQS